MHIFESKSVLCPWAPAGENSASQMSNNPWPPPPVGKRKLPNITTNNLKYFRNYCNVNAPGRPVKITVNGLLINFKNASNTLHRQSVFSVTEIIIWRPLPIPTSAISLCQWFRDDPCPWIMNTEEITSLGVLTAATLVGASDIKRLQGRWQCWKVTHSSNLKVVRNWSWYLNLLRVEFLYMK
jgi:hypothetical protein